MKNVTQTFILQFKDVLGISSLCCVSTRPQGGATNLQLIQNNLCLVLQIMMPFKEIIRTFKDGSLS